MLFKNDYIRWNDEITTSLNNTDFKDFIEDIVNVGIIKHQQFDSAKYLTNYRKYSRRDVCRLLNWDNDVSSTIYGYRTRHNTTPLFVTYHKKDEIESSTNYGDEFLAPDMFRWFSRNRLTTESKEVLEIINHKKLNNDIHLFIKKDDGEGTDFYYLGETSVVEDSAQNETMPDGKSVVTMNMQLQEPVQANIYHYLVEE